MTFFRRHWRKFLILGIVVLVLAAAPFVFIIVEERNALREWETKRLPFEQNAWKANPDSNEMDPIRLRMIDDLLRRYNFMGMSRSAIDDLLGAPAKTDKFRDWNLVYWLGPERGSFRMIPSGWFSSSIKRTRFQLTDT